MTIIILLSMGCSKPSAIEFQEEQIQLVIWDSGGFLAHQSELVENLQQGIHRTTLITAPLAEQARPLIEEAFSSMKEEELCIFMVLSDNTSFHLASEWNLWMPDLWRALPCKSKVLIADAPWGDQLLNPIKQPKDGILVINGFLGRLRPKLQGSLAVASCRYDEVNLVSRGLDGENLFPLFSWYFLDGLIKTSEGVNLSSLLDRARRQTQAAFESELVSQTERVLFFHHSEIHRREFLTFPHPQFWNGLARDIYLEVDF